MSKVLPVRTPDEVLLHEKAGSYSRVSPLTHYPTLSTRWAWQSTLPEDAQQSMQYGPVLRMLDVITHGEATLHEWPSFCLEVFSYLYDSLEHAGEVDPPSELGVALHTWLASAPDWDELRRTCRRKRAIAMTTAASLCNGIARQLLAFDSLALDAEKAKSPEELLEEARNLLEMGVSKDKISAVLDPQLEGSTERRARMMEILDGDSGRTSFLHGLLGALLAAAQDLGVLDDILRGCGLGQSLESAVDPISLELLKRLRAMPDLKALLQLVGRMQRDARGVEATSSVRIRPEGIEKSQQDLLLSEYALSDAAPDLWARRFLDRETMGLRRVGEEPLAEGDLVVVVDDSGSMDGMRAKYARALAAALALEAISSERRVVVAIYSDVSSGQYKDVLALGASDIPALLDVLNVSYKHGTQTRSALLRAAKRLAAPLRAPDIVLITDGDWEPLQARDYAAMRGEDGAGRLYVLLLAPTSAKHKEIPFATRVWSVPELDIRTVKEVLGTIRKSSGSGGGA